MYPGLWRKLEEEAPVQVRKSVLLAVALAALLLLVGVFAIAMYRKGTETQARIAELHAAHKPAGDALSTIRANVYLSSILIRDYLLDPDPLSLPSYSGQFDAIRATTEHAFAVLRTTSSDTAHAAAVNTLHKQLEVYWDPTEMALDWTPEEKRAQRAQLLRQRVRQRQEIFNLASQVEKLMAANFQREELTIRSTEVEFRRSLAWTTGIALALGLLVAGLTLLRMVKLERQSAKAESELRRLSAQLRTAQEEERRYLSRELHDQVGQMLTGLRMELSGLAREPAASDLPARIDQAKASVEQTLRVVRNMAMLLRPSMLDDLGLAPAVEWQVKEFSRLTGIGAAVEVDRRAAELPDPHRTCVYRVVQEALTNAARHSNASRVDVQIRHTEQEIVTIVSDDGSGLGKRGGGLGLIGMEERVRELGGRLRIASGPGRGTRIEATLPDPAHTGEQDDSNPHRRRSRDRENRAQASARTRS